MLSPRFEDFQNVVFESKKCRIPIYYFEIFQNLLVCNEDFSNFQFWHEDFQIYSLGSRISGYLNIVMRIFRTHHFITMISVTTPLESEDCRMLVGLLWGYPETSILLQWVSVTTLWVKGLSDTCCFVLRIFRTHRFVTMDLCNYPFEFENCRIPVYLFWGFTKPTIFFIKVVEYHLVSYERIHNSPFF